MNDTPKLKVGVVFGGISSEREISLESGRHIYQNLNPEKYEGVPIFFDVDGRLWKIPLKLIVQNCTKDIYNLLEDSAERIPYEKLKDVVDFVFIGLHGKYGEDGCFQGLLELLQIPYSGSGVLSSALGMNKLVQREFLQAYDIEVPNSIPVENTHLEEKIDQLNSSVRQNLGGFPCVVKPSREGCSTALAVVKNEDELLPALQEAGEHDRIILIEELIYGRELTCGIIGNENEVVALPPTENPPKGDFLTIEEKFLPGAGVNITPPDMPEELLKRVEQIVLKVYKALNLNVYARIDLFVTEDERIIVTEPNTLPGMTPSTAIFQQAAEADMNPMLFIDKIIELSLEAQKNKIGPL